MTPRAQRWSERLERTRGRHWLILTLICAAAYFPALGTGGLTRTEGHRAIPAWEAMETGRWYPLTMFETVYIRKPPGMSWAIAASSMIFGESEFAARLPAALSAGVMAILAFVFASRWFGPRWGIVAGLAQALLPRYWSSARTADIEALLCLGVQIAAFAIIHATIHRKRTVGRTSWLWAGVAAVGLAIALTAKAQAGLPVIAGVLASACIIRRSLAPVRNPVAWGAPAIALISTAPLAWLFIRAAQADSAVSEDFAKFLWDPRRLMDWMLLPAAVFLGAAPISLALLFPWGRDAQRECEGKPMDERPRLFAVARTLAVAFAIAVGLYLIVGVSNERYVLPALVLLPPLAAYVARGAAEFFTEKRARIASWTTLGSPWTALALLAVALVVNQSVIEPRRNAHSARGAGVSLAPSIPAGAEVWAGSLVNAKPELLWYAKREAERRGAAFRPLWRSAEIEASTMPHAGDCLLLTHVEKARYDDAGRGGMLEPIAEGFADRIPFTLFVVRSETP